VWTWWGRLWARMSKVVSDKSGRLTSTSMFKTH
jgi:hypothetical protein